MSELLWWLFGLAVELIGRWLRKRSGENPKGRLTWI
jgi:hypothetical protein